MADQNNKPTVQRWKRTFRLGPLTGTVRSERREEHGTRYADDGAEIEYRHSSITTAREITTDSPPWQIRWVILALLVAVIVTYYTIQ